MRQLLILLALLWAAVGGAHGVDVGYYPTSSNKLEIVAHQDYALGYWEDMELSAWVVEVLTTNMLVRNCGRVKSFMEDPLVSTRSAASRDYTRSGFDRGHLAPAADFAYDATAMRESFYMSNMTPQVPRLNRGAWQGLERWVREVVRRETNVVVVTGPIVTGAVMRIGMNRVAVPHGYYKVLYDTTPPKKMIGFVYQNKAEESNDIVEHAVTVDEVEKLTGLDFFVNENADELEREVDFERWNE